MPVKPAYSDLVNAVACRVTHVPLGQHGHRTTSLAAGLDEPQHLRRSTAVRCAALHQRTNGFVQRTAATTAHLGITDHQTPIPSG